MSRHGYGHGGQYQFEQAMGSLIGLMIVLLVILIWLFIKALNMIVRVMIKHPNNKLMKVQALLVALFVLLALLAVGSHLVVAYGVFASLAVLTFLALTATARIVELYYNEYFIEDVKLTDRVLKRPWWSGAQQQISSS